MACSQLALNCSANLVQQPWLSWGLPSFPSTIFTSTQVTFAHNNVFQKKKTRKIETAKFYKNLGYIKAFKARLSSVRCNILCEAVDARCFLAVQHLMFEEGGQRLQLQKQFHDTEQFRFWHLEQEAMNRHCLVQQGTAPSTKTHCRSSEAQHEDILRRSIYSCSSLL